MHSLLYVSILLFANVFEVKGEETESPCLMTFDMEIGNCSLEKIDMEITSENMQQSCMKHNSAMACINNMKQKYSNCPEAVSKIAQLMESMNTNVEKCTIENQKRMECFSKCQPDPKAILMSNGDEMSMKTFCSAVTKSVTCFTMAFEHAKDCNFEKIANGSMMNTFRQMADNMTKLLPICDSDIDMINCAIEINKTSQKCAPLIKKLNIMEPNESENLTNKCKTMSEFKDCQMEVLNKAKSCGDSYKEITKEIQEQHERIEELFMNCTKALEMERCMDSQRMLKSKCMPEIQQVKQMDLTNVTKKEVCANVSEVLKCGKEEHYLINKCGMIEMYQTFGKNDTMMVMDFMKRCLPQSSAAFNTVQLLLLFISLFAYRYISI